MRVQRQQLGSQPLSQPLFELASPYQRPQTEPFARQLEVVDDLAGRSGVGEPWQQERLEEDYGSDIDSDMDYCMDDDSDNDGDEKELL